VTGIQWTEAVWNPTTGCDRVSPGCDHCYALTMAKRLKGMGQAKYQRDGDPKTSGPGFGLTVHPDALAVPLRWRKPRKVFVNSMSDLFHESVSATFIAAVFDVMRQTPQHTYQILTKRHARMRSLARTAAFGEGWPLPNVWLGVSVEDQKWADIRIPALLQTPAAVRFLSCEPLLGPVKLPFIEEYDGCTCGTGPAGYYGMHEHGCGTEPGPAWDRLHWVIAGGESGSGARPCELGWLRHLRNQCAEVGVPIFVKQLGAVLGRQHDAGPHGADWDQWPADLRVREFPRIAEAVPA
jgi:protein gp37